MLKLRIITALILVPIVIAAILFLSPLYFAIITGIFFIMGAWEWANLCDFKMLGKIGFALVFVLTSFLVLGFEEYVWLAVLTLGTVFWLLPLIWIIRYRGKPPILLQSTISRSAIGILCLTSAWYALNAIQQWPHLIILLFVLIWSTDSFAYFAGRKWGVKPLASYVSPKKTLAGFWGGLIGTMLIAVLTFGVFLEGSFSGLADPEFTFQVFWKDPLFFLTWFLIALFCSLLAVVGDLFESLIKRIAQVKDSGTLLPGHGGILDRIDSLIAALPFYALCINVIAALNGM